MSLISTKDIENGAQELNPVRLLVNTPGVQIQQHSLNSINIERAEVDYLEHPHSQY